MVEITISVVLQIIQTVSLVVGIIYYLTIMRNSQENQKQALETRQAQLYMTLHETRRSPEFQKQWYKTAFLDEWESYEDYLNKYGPENDFESYAEHGSIYQFYDGIGFLLKKKIIDLSYIDDNLRHSILLIWDRHESIINGNRRRLNRPHLWKHFEYLVNEIQEYHEKHTELNP
ncbi:hypothetical protein AN643_04305 [Candidatus Epulonipiscioides saccharophilum]|nr:hypothetical protein AN643_04305 [Epulopiscium sp. SCG-B10WGA-EpuloB]